MKKAHINYSNRHAYLFAYVKLKLSNPKYRPMGISPYTFHHYIILSYRDPKHSVVENNSIKAEIAPNCFILFIFFLYKPKSPIQGMIVCSQCMMNLSCTFHHDVYLSDCVLCYPFLESFTVFSRTKSRCVRFYLS